MYKILKKQKIGQGIYELRIEAKHIVKYAKPGNFIILRKNETGERAPFTIANLDNKSITILFNVVGKTTADLAKLKKGDSIKDVAGPLGNPSEIGEFGTVCIVSGGTGCASAYLLSKALKEKRNKVINILGAKSKDQIIWEDKFSNISDRLIVCTDDGSKGMHCLVTKPLEKLLKKQYFNRVIAIGPPVMMKEVARLTYQRARTFVHLAPIMVDGIGMCGGCRVKVGNETKFACVDGPEFDAHEVDFDSIIYRNSRYFDEEQESHEKHHGSCITKAATKKKTPVKQKSKKTISKKKAANKKDIASRKKKKTINKKPVKKKTARKTKK